MTQRFRRDVDDIPTGNFDDLHDMCRQRVLSYLHALHVVLKRCEQCGEIKMSHERIYWCCKYGDTSHYKWPSVGPELQDLINKPSWGVNARMINSLFSQVIIYSGDKGAGFTYHVGSGPPSLRISGQMYARFMRTPDTCWFLHDANYYTTFSKLKHESIFCFFVCITSNHQTC